MGGDSTLHQLPGEADATQSPPALSEHPGTRIGHYKLLEQIGEGGFGIVWMAEQEEPVRRRGALKIIKLGMDTREVVARFEAERQALSMMEHPNIACVFDGGATATGRPYFVMELVKGVPITTYCNVNRLTTKKRLELLMEVCHAVQHAHQKGVIHRDLKPSNILVTVKDDRAVPKVIDFGIAKATQAVLTEKTLFTRLNQWIGTPAYMSPEQAGLGSLDVDTRSDIYSLGVLPYELLTGRPPFDPEKLLAVGYDAVMRVIREEEPPKPSTRLSTMAEEELTAVAAKHGSEPAKLGRLVRGDLDWIVMKALEKDRRRRYETANGLADDLRHHLNDEPVEAGAPSQLYRLRKLIRRNKVAYGAVGAIAASLLIGFSVSTRMFFREKDALERSVLAEREQSRLAKESREFAEESARAKDQSEANAYASRILLAAQLWQNGDVENAEKTLDECAPPLRGWEWNYLKRKFHSELLTLPALHLDPEDGLPFWDFFGYWPERRNLAFARDDTQLWISMDLAQYPSKRGKGGFYDLTNGTSLLVQPNWLPGVPTADGRHILSQAKPDSPAAIIDVASGRVLTTLKAAPGTPLALSPDGRLIASWTKDAANAPEVSNRLLISSSTDGQVLQQIPWEAGGAGLQWSPDSRWLAAGGADAAVTSRVLEANTGRIVLTFKSTSWRRPAFSADSGRLVWLEEDRNTQTDTANFPLSVWDLHTGQLLFERVLHSCPNVVSFAQRDRTLVVAGLGWKARPGRSDPSGQDELFLFDADSGELRCGLRLDSGLGEGPRSLDIDGDGVDSLHGVIDLSVSPDGERFAAGTLDGSVHVVEVARPERHQILRGHRAAIHSVVFDATGSRLASRDLSGEVKLWDVSPSATPALKEAYAGNIALISTNGRCVVWEGEDCLQVADLDRRQHLVLPLVRNRTVSISPDGRWLNEPRGIWDMEQGALVRHGGGERLGLLWFSGDGRRAAHLTYTPESAKGPLSAQVVDTATWLPVGALLVPDLGFQFDEDGIQVFRGFQLNEDGTLAAIMGANGRVHICGVASAAGSTKILAEFAGAPPFQFGPDGSWLLAGRAEGGFQQVEVRTGIVRGTFPSRTENVRGFEISRSGRHVHVRGERNYRQGGEIWDLQTGELLGKMPSPVHPDSMVFHPGGKRMALQGPDSLLRIWDLDQRKVLITLPVQPLAWAWSRDGNRLMVVLTDLEIEEFDGSPWKPGERNAPGLPFKNLTAARATGVPGVEIVARLSRREIVGEDGSAAAVRPGTICHIDDCGMILYQLPADPNAERVAFLDSYRRSNPLGPVGNKSDTVRPGEYLFTTAEGQEVYRPENPADPSQRVACHDPRGGDWYWPTGFVVAGNLACDLVNPPKPPSETQIFDISVPQSAVLRGTFSSPLSARCGYLAGQHLYLGQISYGDEQRQGTTRLVEAVDLTDPSHPVSVGQLALPEIPCELLGAGPDRLVALLGESVVLIDISDPARMKMIGKPLSAPAHTGVLMPWGERRLLITGAAAISVADNGLKLEGWLPGQGSENATCQGDLAIIPNDSWVTYVCRVRPPP